MDNKSFLAVVLSLLVLVVYQALVSYFYPLPPPSTRNPSAPQTASPTTMRTPTIEQPAQAQSAPQDSPLTTAPVAAAQEISVENEVYRAVFTSAGGRIKSFRLKQHPGDEGKHSPPLEMIQAGGRGELPLGVLLEGNGVTLSDDGVRYTVTGKDTILQGSDTATLEFRGTTANGTTIVKTFSFSGQSYGIALDTKLAAPIQEGHALSLLWTHAFDQHHAPSYSEPGPVALVGRKFVYNTNSGVKAEPQSIGPDRVRWAGYANTYFLSAIIPPEGEKNALLFQANDGTVTTKLSIPHESQNVQYTIYIGPKQTDALNTVNPSLDRAIDFGWSHFIARPLLSLLKVSHSLTGNYGLDIILLTVLVKLAFFPLSAKAFRSMNEMKKVQPQLEQIREQYKDDREKLNREMMELYRRNKINPLGGCLPMLVQIPVFIGLYQVFMYAIELRQAPFFGWIQDLSQPDRLGSMWLPFVEPAGIPVLTILMGATMVIQQAMTPMPGDPVQQKMMMIMPVIFTIMFINFPAGLVLYWLVNNVLSIAQQYAQNKGIV
ncbi:MAG: membrane protein insertase YidC [Deltaproteobacteria bacterium]|nr:membrane protein insertase YidC [Deltaproteobacteria bacterium]